MMNRSYLLALLCVSYIGICRAEEPSTNLSGNHAGVVTSLLTSIGQAVGYFAADIAAFGKEAVTLADDAVIALEEYPASVYARLACEKPDHYSSEPASVASHLSLAEEKSCLAARRVRAQKALSKLLERTVTEDLVPVVGFCGSGGGVRAHYGTLGWLSAAESIGLLETVQYVSGLSGSTWALNPWIASQLSIKDYIKQTIPRLTETVQEHLSSLTSKDMADLLTMLGRSYYNKRSLSLVDLYSWYLGHTFLSALPNVEQPYEYSLSSLRPQIESGQFPYVISTSSVGADELIETIYSHYPTFEWTPLFSGSFEAGFFVPTWAVGRIFLGGMAQPCIPRTLFPEVTLLVDKVASYDPRYAKPIEAVADLITYLDYQNYYGCELPLASIMGVCGSAFSVDMRNLLAELMELIHPLSQTHEAEQPLSLFLSALQAALDYELGKLASQLSQGELSQQSVTDYLNNDEFVAASIANPCYQLPGHALASEKEITLLDAGLDLIALDRCNIGIIPLLCRGVDCIFICDNSADISGAPSLRAAEKVARKCGYPFPSIAYDEISQHEVTLIADEDNIYAPVIVYIPVVPNERYSRQLGHQFDPLAPAYVATDFTYSETQAHELMGLVEYLVMNNKALFAQALEKAVSRKKALLNRV